MQKWYAFFSTGSFVIGDLISISPIQNGSNGQGKIICVREGGSNTSLINLIRVVILHS
jgi:hypothetical protein